ncbi:zinc finger protein 3-like [Engraulis encrasicolus]|uniref:zinc finger protein 3-like n=1 Tax=Engraulis encrasicolus TaxID=184585 RepID=UPI002FD663FE
MDSPPPWSSLRLLIPPVRLISACMWQVAQEQHLEHYEHLENFVTLVTKIVPNVLSQRQRSTLIMGLRAKVLLEMCRGDLPVDSDTIKKRLHQMQPTDHVKSNHSEMNTFQRDLSSLIFNLLEDPAKKEDFFQRVYPVEYGPDFDKALQVLVCYFLSRLDQLLPVPNFKQVASWMKSSCVWDECEQYMCHQTEDLQHLLQQNRHRSLDNNGLPSIVEDRVISALSLPPSVDLPHSKSIFQREACVVTLSPSPQPAGELHQDSQGLNTTSAANRDGELEQGKPRKDVETERDQRVSEERGSETTAVSITSRLSQKKCGRKAKVLKPKASKTRPSQESAQKVTPLLLSGISSNRQHDPKGKVRLPPVGQWKRPTLSQRAQKQCPHCSRSFAYYSEFLRHQRQSHQRLYLRKAATFPCGDCERTFDSLTALKQHQKPKKKPIKCSRCGQTFERLCGFMSHQATHQDDPPDPTPASAPSTSTEERPTADIEDEPVTKISATECRFCGLNFFTTLELKDHLMTHTELNPHRCSLCHKSFAHRYTLVAHMAMHKGDKPCLCETCGKSFYTIQHLKAHMKLHKVSSEKATCPYCGKTLSTEQNLRTHIRIHTGERPFVCAQCGKGFNEAATLRTHMLWHSGEKPFRCGVCDKAFVTKSLRNWHQRSHTGDIPRRHVCSTCGKTFVRRACWKKHLVVHTGERNFRCPLCPNTYKRKSHLDIHIKKHNNDMYS